MQPSVLLQRLSRARWHVMRRTYGNSHSTLAGLLVDWWVSLSPGVHSILEGPPACGTGNAGWCDAMFCEKDDPAGVLEVERQNPVRKIGTIERYFDSEKFRTLRFAILLVYSPRPRGRGWERRYPATETPSIVNAMKEPTDRHRDRSAILVTLDKAYQCFTEGLRSRTIYYSGTTSAIEGMLFTGGRAMDRVKYL